MAFLKQADARPDGSFADAYYIKANNFDRRGTLDLLRELVRRECATVPPYIPDELQLAAHFQITVKGRVIARASQERVDA